MSGDQDQVPRPSYDGIKEVRQAYTDDEANALMKAGWKLLGYHSNKVTKTDVTEGHDDWLFGLLRERKQPITISNEEIETVYVLGR